MTKRTLFKQLTVAMIPTIVVLFLIVETLNFVHLRNTHLDYFEEENQLVLKSIQNLLQFRDISLSVLESNLDKRMHFTSQMLTEKEFTNTSNIENLDLEVVKQNWGLNKLMEDIRIINRQGVVVNSSFQKDNLLHNQIFTSEYLQFLDKMLLQSPFFRERLSLSKSYERKRVYSYTSTKDGKYYVELGFYSTKIAQIDADFTEKIRQLALSIRHIGNINIFTRADIGNSADSSLKMKPTFNQALKETFRTERSHSVSETKNGHEKAYHYFYINMINSSINKGYVAEVVTKHDKLNLVLQNELLSYALVMLFSILLLSTYINYQTKRVSYPIRGLLEKVARISQGDFNQRVEVDGYREIAELSENFNTMVDRLQVLYKDLEAKVKERTIDLEKTNEQLTSLVATKDKFFAIIGHDLKNPFHNIQNLCEIILNPKEALLPEANRELVSMISTEAKYCLTLLVNLLEWSRTQTGSLEIKPSNIDLNALMQESVSMFQSMAQNKQILLQAKIEKSLLAYADQNMVKTVCRNLISNALKFTSIGGLVSIEGIENEANIEIRIHDSGVGISEEDLDKLFKISMKTSRLGTNSEKGTGIGLNLCQEFIKKNGGQIWVTSQVNEGSCFYFTLPKSENPV